MAENEKKVAPEQKPQKQKSDKPSLFKKAASWLKSVKSECKKIAWAGWKSVRTSTVIVVVCVLILAAVFGLLDVTLGQAIIGLGKLFH